MVERSLIVCRDMSGWKWLEKNGSYFGSELLVLASDDWNVQKQAKNSNRFEYIDFIEKTESVFEVGNDVISLQEKITAWLKTLNSKKGFPVNLLYFIRQVEGGMTTQRIQDCVLLIRAYLSLFKRYKIQNIHLLCGFPIQWEDELLIETARARRIKIQCKSLNRHRYAFDSIWRITKSFFYEPYFFLSFLKFKFRPNKVKWMDSEIQRCIYFQLCSSAEKHVENIILLMKALKEKSYLPIALCWQAEDGSSKVKREGLNAVELEQFLKLRDWINTIARLTWTWKEIRKRKKEFVSQTGLFYMDVSLGKVLWPSVVHFVFAELPQRFRLQIAASAFFQNQKPLAVKLWGRLFLAQGKILWDVLARETRPLLFHYSLGIEYEDPYSVPEPGDLWLATGQIQKELFMRHLKVPEEKIVTIGPFRYSKIEKFSRENSELRSRSILGIPEGFIKYILYDYGGVLRGYISKAEVYDVTDSLYKFASQHQDIALVFKPHPSADIQKLKTIDKEKREKNIFITEKNALPYHAINACDCLITKYSTMGIEAMLFNKPVVSIILDGEARWRIFEDAAEYMYRIQDLLDLLKKICYEQKYFMEWKKEINVKQHKFLTRYFGRIENNGRCQQKESACIETAPELGAAAIDDLIRKYRNYRREKI